MQKLESPAGPTVRAVSARTVRYVYTILRSALGDAVEQGRLSVNPTDRATAPGPSEARPPEMQPWTTPEFTRFLRWADGDDVADDLPRIGEITPNDMASPRCMRRSPRPAHLGPGVRVDDERLDPTGSAIAL